MRSTPIASQTVSASVCLCLSICHSGVKCVWLPQLNRLYRFLSGWQTTSGQSAPETGHTFSPFRIKIPPVNTRNDCSFSLSAGRSGDLRGKDEHKVTAMSVDFCVQLHILQIFASSQWRGHFLFPEIRPATCCCSSATPSQCVNCSAPEPLHCSKLETDRYKRESWERWRESVSTQLVIFTLTQRHWLKDQMSLEYSVIKDLYKRNKIAYTILQDGFCSGYMLLTKTEYT